MITHAPSLHTAQYNDGVSCFPLLFERVVQQNPHASALLFGDRSWTYDDLNRMANRIAHLVKRETEGKANDPEQAQFLGVYLQRSPLLAATVLGCMKAGQPFLLLDPDYPPERLAFMQRDADVRTILTQKDLLSAVPAREEDTTVVCLDASTSPVSEHEENMPWLHDPSDVMCAIFTSGTEGQIKAAYIEYQVLPLLHREQKRLYGVSPSDRILQFATQGYDAFLWEMTMGLLSGATLCLGSKKELEAGPVLHAFLRDNRISIASLTPTVLASLPDSPLPDLQTIIAIGEYCPRPLVQRYAPGRHFHNAYGLMEAGICQTSGECFATDEGDPSIGMPLNHVTIQVLDAEHHPVLPGELGEIVVSGPAVSPRGYLNRPELTARTFASDPRHLPTHGLCSTGDKGRLNGNGSVTLYGRMKRSDVFKARGGIRVERRELEVALLAHPLLRDGACHVVQQEYLPGETRIVAFLILSLGEEAPPYVYLSSQLRTFLLTQTTVRVAPDVFVVLTSFPLNSNDKLDEQALERWVLPEEREDQEYIAPQTETERILAEHLLRLFQSRRISATADLLKRRNNSLSVAQFATTIHRAFGVTLNALTIVHNPTIQQLATVLDQRHQATTIQEAAS